MKSQSALLDNLDFMMEVPSCTIHHRELVCPECLAQACGLHLKPKRKSPTVTTPRLLPKRLRDQPGYLSSRDCLAIFEKEPEGDFTVEALLARVPARKRAEAEENNAIFAKVQYLFKKGSIVRLERGTYRLAPRQQRNGPKAM